MTKEEAKNLLLNICGNIKLTLKEHKQIQLAIDILSSNPQNELNPKPVKGGPNGNTK